VEWTWTKKPRSLQRSTRENCTTSAHLVARKHSTQILKNSLAALLINQVIAAAVEAIDLAFFGALNQYFFP
jgi:hypothetical protein